MSTVNLVTGEIVERPTEAQVRASIRRVIDHAESIWDEWAWQVENQTWLVIGYASWDEMRRSEYGNLTSISAPRAERPELVARFRGVGLTQQETADTLGVSQDTVSRHDPTDNTGKGRPRLTDIGNSDSDDDVIDAEIVEDEQPTCSRPAPASEREADGSDPWGWEQVYKSFRELAKHLVKNPSPEQRERLARGLQELLREVTK